MGTLIEQTSICSGAQDDFNALKIVFQGLEDRVEKFQEDTVAQWSQEAKNTSQDNLKKPILKRDEEGGLLTVNFDKDLIQLTREAKYFTESGVEIPEQANEIFEKCAEYRQQVNSLQL